MKPIALEAYEKLAEAYAAMVETKPHNAYLDHILEPVPSPEFHQIAPEEAERHSREPTFIHIRARKA